MKEVTKTLIKRFELERLKYDFMGYHFDNISQLSYHHLLLPNYYCVDEYVEDKGYSEWNGSILTRDTSHNYLHIIERYDFDMFLAITSEMYDEIVKGYLDFENIKYIDDILLCFEKEYSGKVTKKGTDIVKEEYTRRLIKH